MGDVFVFKRACFVVLAAMLVLTPIFTRAAELLFSPASGQFSVGADFSVRVTVDPKDAEINAADGEISFDKDLLSVTSISKDGSAFSLWTAEPSYSNAQGTVSFSGGTPSAFARTGTVITVKFKAKKAGSAKLSFAKGQVLAADGKGTNVYDKGGEATYELAELPDDPAPAAEEESQEGNGATPILPVITSSTHAKPDIWYATNTVEFSWKVTDDVTGQRTLFSDKPDATPNVLRGAAVTSQTQKDVADGEWYFYLQFRNEFGWGEVASKKVMIDTVPPLEFDFVLLEQDGEPPKFGFQTQDELSGVEKFEILLGETIAASAKAAEVTNGSYPVPPQPGGPTKVTIKAYDKAGNVRVVTKDITLPEVIKSTTKKGEEEEEAPPIFTVERILALIFAFIIGGLVSWNMYYRKQVQRQRMIVLRSVAEIRDKNDKIFSAMREEFEQMVNDFDAKPQLTPEERDFLEKIKEVLEISEELVDTGMEELKKTIRGQQ